WSLDFQISPSVLVPRPDTETLVAAAFDWADRTGRREDKLRVVDRGTGSGVILLALPSELPLAVGIGTDRDEAALATARLNAETLSLAARATFRQSDWTNGIEGKFDLVLSNPPYIESDAIAALEPEVRDHDPRLALDGGGDGL